MNRFDPSSDRGINDPWATVPLGRNPFGHWIVSAEDLPKLPLPKQVAVTREQIEIDGWVFPLACVSESLLVWLQASFLRWVKEDDSEENRKWINGIAEAFQDGLAGKL